MNADMMQDTLDQEVDDDLIAEHGPYRLTKTSVIAMRDGTFEEWEAAVTWAKDVERASPFWIGDLMLLGEGRFGEMASQVEDATGMSYQVIADAKYVAKAIPVSRRRENVPFSIHKEVAKLPPAEQTQWLAKAENEDLTREQVRHRIKVSAAAEAGVAVEYTLTVVCNDAADQQTLADQLRLAGRHVKLGTKEIA